MDQENVANGLVANRLNRQMVLILALVALIVPLGAGLLAAFKHFDGLYGQDAFAYYDYAVVSLKQQLYPPPPFFWPPGYPLLVLATSLVVGVTPFAGMLVSLICGWLTAFCTMLITAELSPIRGYFAPIVAGLVIGLAGQMWQSSNVIMADTASLAAATLGMWAVIHYARSEKPHGGWLALAAGAIAYAMICRWIYVAVAVVVAPYALWRLIKLARATSPRIAIRHALIAALAAGLILAPVLIATFGTSASEPPTYGGNFQYQLVQWDLFNAFRRSFVNPDGQQTFPLPNGIYYASLPFRTFYLTPLLTPLALVGLWVIARRKQLLPFLPLLAWGIAAYLLLVGEPEQNVRFTLTYLPPIVVLIGIGAAALWIWFKSVPVARGALILMLVGGFAWQTVSAVRYTSEFIDRKEQMLDVVEWTQAQLPAESQLITLGPTLMMRHYTPIETHEIYYLTDADLERLTALPRPTYLLLDLYNVETQWQGRSPSLNYHWLRDHTSLQKIGESGGYTLFEIRE
ncbi:MAG TPA: hypothetical protein VHL11_10865 [Phototrophicaceae bacterium]|nr:hypothetical protein [Phototrophicaceae bacterium]